MLIKLDKLEEILLSTEVNKESKEGYVNLATLLKVLDRLSKSMKGDLVANPDIVAKDQANQRQHLRKKRELNLKNKHSGKREDSFSRMKKLAGVDSSYQPI